MINRINLLLIAFAIMFLSACAGSKSSSGNGGSSNGSGGIGNMLGGLTAGSSKPVPSNGTELPEERTRESIMEVVNERLPELQKIYDDYLDLKPGFNGRVMLKFTINPKGDIIAIFIVSSTTGAPEFDNFIKDAVATWKWQPIKSGNTTPTIPFNFSE